MLLLVGLFSCVNNKKVEDENNIVTKNGGVHWERIMSDHSDVDVHFSQPIVVNQVDSGVVFSVGVEHDPNRKFTKRILLNDIIHRDYKDDEFILKYKLKKGGYYTLVYLIDEHGVSVKSPHAADIEFFKIGGAERIPENQKQMYLLSPSNHCSKDDEVLLDFYLIHTNLKNGDYIDVVLDDKYKHVITDWSAFKIKGLSTGEHKLKMTLKDKKGNVISGPYNDIERHFCLE